MTKASIALNRFGLGARGDQPVPADPLGWLTGQFAKYDPVPDVIASAPTSAGVSAELADYFRQQRALRAQQATKLGGPAAPPPAAAIPVPAGVASVNRISTLICGCAELSARPTSCFVIAATPYFSSVVVSTTSHFTAGTTFGTRP